MEFGYYLPGYARDISRPVQHLYRELIREAQWAEDLGFTSFTIPEHHFTNALMHPNALLTGIKLAEHTKHARIVTSTSILPFRDMLWALLLKAKMTGHSSTIRSSAIR